MKQMTPSSLKMMRLPITKTVTKCMSVIGLLLLIPFACHASDDGDFYGAVPEEHYLTGRFSAPKHPHFIALGKLNIPATGRSQFLRREAGQALVQMITAFQKEHPGTKIRVLSTHRSFYNQRYIWQAKWTGQRLSDGMKLNETHPDPTARAKNILRYSAMPGASRHHWGTEVDINSLRNSYFEKGPGLIIYSWLKQNASKYGFCQPYTAGRKQGHLEEKWHWSYRPLAAKFQRKWEELFSENTDRFLRNATFAGNQAAAPLAPVYQQRINPTCTKNN